MKKRKTHEEYVEELANVNQNIIVVGHYVNYLTKILHKCKLDGHEWYAIPSNTLKGHGCPMCSGSVRITHDEYIVKVKDINPDIEVVDTYVSSIVAILHRCKKDGYEWFARPSTILRGIGCPVCSDPPKAIGPAPEYKNSIWSSPHKEYFSRYLTEHQMKSYMPHSGKLIEIVCPDCGRKKMIKPTQLVTYGLGCVCGDKISFANKFVLDVLTQLKLSVTPEYTPEWSMRKRYDDYIETYNLIVENHGIQHYVESKLGNQSLCDIQNNDLLKQAMAKENGIQHYIVLDCRYSSLEWIKNSIMSSQLPEILNFTEADIDWAQAARFASTNLIKEAANMYNSGISVKDIGQAMKISLTSIRKWLHLATEMQWCNYDGRATMMKFYDTLKKRVLCVELNLTFDSVVDASKFISKSKSQVADCCLRPWTTAGGYHWQYI